MSDNQFQSASIQIEYPMSNWATYSGLNNNKNEINMTDVGEIARAIQESAKLGEKGLEIADKAGSFLTRIFKEPIDEITGMITDKLRFIRWKRMVQMADEVNIILKEKNITDTRAIPPKIALPILEEATLEEDPKLQYLWNHLLANAMNPMFNDEVRYGFIEMIKGITGIDAKLLYEFYEILKSRNQLSPIENVTEFSLTKDEIIQFLKVTPGDYVLSVNNLMRMQLISPALYKTGASYRTVKGASFRTVKGISGMERLTIFKGTDALTLTPLGVKFVEACMK